MATLWEPWTRRWPIRIIWILCALLPLTIAPFSLCQQTTGAPAPSGQAIFLYRCAKCHGAAGQGRSAFISFAGPSLQAEHDPGRVLTAIETGPSHMPSFAWTLSVPQMRAVANYVTQHIATIPLTGGNIGPGGVLFRMHCAVCHRTAVRGGALVFTGVNAPALTNKSAALIAGAVRWGPGQMPSFPPSVVNDQEISSIVKYIQFVQHPRNRGGSPIAYYGPVSEGFIAFLAIFILIGISMLIEKGGKG